jgi:hypothetical protein
MSARVAGDGRRRNAGGCRADGKVGAGLREDAKRSAQEAGNKRRERWLRSIAGGARSTKARATETKSDVIVGAHAWRGERLTCGRRPA